MIKRTQDVNNKKNTRGSDGKRSTLFPVSTRRRKVRLSDITKQQSTTRKSRYRHLQQQSNKENEYKGSTRAPKQIIIVTTLRSDNVKKYTLDRKQNTEKRKSRSPPAGSIAMNNRDSDASLAIQWEVEVHNGNNNND